jgi:hypothetical protein
VSLVFPAFSLQPFSLHWKEIYRPDSKEQERRKGAGAANQERKNSLLQILFIVFLGPSGAWPWVQKMSGKSSAGGQPGTKLFLKGQRKSVPGLRL